MKIVYFFCVDPAKDKVAPAAFQACCDLFQLNATGIHFDNMESLRYEDDEGNVFVFVQTSDVLSHDYERYTAKMNENFADFDLAGIVNWHEGGNAPDPIFCAHTNGDVSSGIFPPANPTLTTAMLLSMDKFRKAAGLDDWAVLPEATHFSGVQYGTPPSALLNFKVPLIDVEIGSSPDSWSNNMAIDVLVRSLVGICEFANLNSPSILFMGGMHFEPSLHAAVINPNDDSRFCYSQMLPNQWVASGDYQGDAGIQKLRLALESIVGGVQAIVFHEGLKGPFKQVARTLGTELRIPVIKHKRLRDGWSALRT